MVLFLNIYIMLHRIHVTLTNAECSISILPIEWMHYPHLTV